MDEKLLKELFDETKSLLSRLQILDEKSKESQEFTNPEVEDLTVPFGATGIPKEALPFPKNEEFFDFCLNKSLDTFKYGIKQDGHLMRFLTSSGVKGVQALNDPSSEYSDNLVTLKRDVEFEATVLASYIERLQTDLYLTGGKEDLEDIIQILHDFNIKICTKIVNNEYRSQSRPGISVTNVENKDYAVKVLSERSPEEKARRTYKSVTRPPIVEEIDLSIWDCTTETIEEFKLRVNN